MHEVVGAVVSAGLELIQGSPESPSQTTMRSTDTSVASSGTVIGGHLPTECPEFVEEIELGVPTVSNEQGGIPPGWPCGV